MVARLVGPYVPRSMRLLPLLLVLLGCGPATEPCPLIEGELTIDQLHLPGPPIGESALVTAPDGTRLLIDVGNDSHDDFVREAAGAGVDFVLLTHDDPDHVGGFPRLDDVVGEAELIDATGTWDLGDGATLTVFLADGVLALPGGDLDLRDEVPNLDTSDNARSLAGAITWGDFVYVFAGDLTGGGKGTPDVESAVASRGDDLLAPGSADAIHLSHHGIRSSTNQAWVEWLLPADGAFREAVVGANGGYLAAPHEEVVARVAPRLGGGRIHASGVGTLAPDDPALAMHDATVRVAVVDAGATWSICAAVPDPGQER